QGLTFAQALGPNRYEIDSIVIDGHMTMLKAEVFGTLRDCCTKGRLTGIDMSQCFSIENDEIPAMAFFPELVNGKPRKAAGDDDERGYRTNLRYITLPGRISKIGDGAFACTNLVAVGIPSMVREIGNGAFAGCEHLKDVILYGGRGQAEASGYQFSGLPANAVLHVAPGTADRYRNSEGWAAFGKVDEIEEAYRVMDISVDGSRRLKDMLAGYDMQVDSIKLGGTPTAEDFDLLKNNCWYGRLYSIDLSDCDVTAIGKGRLSNTRLAYLRMPKTMPVISGCFLMGAKVENLILPESYGEISHNAFENYDWFMDSTLVIQEGCRKIGYMAFVNCHSLKTVVLPSTLDELEPAALGFTWMQDWLEPEVDLYVNRMTPPYCSDTYNGKDVDQDGPFACDRDHKGKGWCLTRKWRLFVPVGAKKNYENAVHWDHFATIIETPLLTGTSTGISGATADLQQTAVKEVYTADGRLVTKGTALPRLGKGLYIVKTGGETKKIMVK
ncbi:MAG: leucine-rich repeat protein, partial [Prevotella sp.]|nr:leucine-rich repeat protein [Prevotella sp.]